MQPETPSEAQPHRDGKRQRRRRSVFRTAKDADTRRHGGQHKRDLQQGDLSHCPSWDLRPADDGCVPQDEEHEADSEGASQEDHATRKGDTVNSPRERHCQERQQFQEVPLIERQSVVSLDARKGEGGQDCHD